MATKVGTGTVGVPEASRELGIPYRTVMNWLKAEDGPIRGQQDASGEWRIATGELKRFAQARGRLRVDAAMWQAAAQVVREEVVRARDENNVALRAAAERLLAARVASAEWESATDDLRVHLAEDAALFNTALEIARRVQVGAYQRARKIAGRGSVVEGASNG